MPPLLAVKLLVHNDPKFPPLTRVLRCSYWLEKIRALVGGLRGKAGGREDSPYMLLPLAWNNVSDKLSVILGGTLFRLEGLRYWK